MLGCKRGNVANDIFAGLGLSGQRQTYLVISWIYSIGVLCLQNLRFSSVISTKNRKIIDNDHSQTVGPLSPKLQSYNSNENQNESG